MKPARPRDALGRPLPWGEHGVEPEPDVRRQPGDALARAQVLLDGGRPFAAHEVLETAWKAAPPPERDLWQGLAQLAVAVTHAGRGNAAGAGALLARGAANLAPYAVDPPYRLNLAALLAWARGGEADHMPPLVV